MSFLVPTFLERVLLARAEEQVAEVGPSAIKLGRPVGSKDTVKRKPRAPRTPKAKAGQRRAKVRPPVPYEARVQRDTTRALKRLAARGIVL